MKKVLYIGLMSIGLVACSTVSTAPLDDAYYWEKSQPAQSTHQIIQSTQSSPAPAPKQTVEYTNVQDTTVTIRIRK